VAGVEILFDGGPTTTNREIPPHRRFLVSDRECFFQNLDEMASAAVGPDQGWVNMNIRFLTSAITGFGEVCLFRASFPPGAQHKAHIHPNAAEFFYVISGYGASGCGEVEHGVRSGAFELVAKGVIHWLRNTSETENIEVVGGYLAVGSLEEAGYVPVGQVTAAEGSGGVA
jgi:quercetin dioxygenase-like cupin family protein